MKLLLCKECSDVFSLSYDEKKCGCGKTGGKYHDKLNATYWGEGIPMGFNNRSFIESVIKYHNTGIGEDFTAFIISTNCNTFTKK